MKIIQQTLTRSKLKHAFHHKLSLDLQSSANLLESIISETTQILASGKELKIVSFGTFLIYKKKERIGRNPKTKVEAIISSRKSISFRPSTLLRKKINRTF
jgi:integration host factor subunit alpha